MEIKTALIELQDGQQFSIEGGPATELAHKLIDACVPELHTVIPQAKIDQWKVEAHKEYVSQPSGKSEYELFCELYLRLSQKQLFALERAKQSYNVMVIELTDKIKRLEAQPEGPEIFPGTCDALDSLTIRPDENA